MAGKLDRLFGGVKLSRDSINSSCLKNKQGVSPLAHV